MLVERRFDTGEVVLNYAKGPNNGPPILLIHGITSNWRNFLPIMPSITMRWHVYAIDLRGHGKSEHKTGQEQFIASNKVFIIICWLPYQLLRWGNMSLSIVITHPPMDELIMSSLCHEIKRLAKGIYRLNVKKLPR